MNEFLLKKASFRTVVATGVALAMLSMTAVSALAATTVSSELQITVNDGTLAIDIMDAGDSSVGSPSVTMSAASFDFNCQAAGSTGTLGSASQVINAQNPDAADSGWSLSMAPSATTDVWDSAGTDIDFNDASGSCGDGGDADSLGGQLTVDPSGGTISDVTTDFCSTCSSPGTTGLTAGSSTAYNEGTTDAVTLITAGSSSGDIGVWDMTGVSLSQSIPGAQPAASDYTLDLVFSVQ